MKRIIKAALLPSLALLLTGCAENSVGGKLAEGGKVLFLGMAVIFAMLAIIFTVVKVISHFCYSPANKPNESNRKTATPAAQAVSANEAVPAPQADDEEEIVAAITAAISAYTGKAAGSFRVVSFKRIK